MIDTTYSPPHMKIHPAIIGMIDEIEELCGYEIVITSGFRTREDHSVIYAKKAWNKEYPFEDGVFDKSKIPWGSDHLSKGSSNYIYGVDFQIKIPEADRFMTGDEIYGMIQKIAPGVELFVWAIGVGRFYIHLGYRYGNKRHQSWRYF